MAKPFMTTPKVPSSICARIKDEWLRGRTQPITESKYRILLPAIKIGEIATHLPWNHVHCSGITVKVQDLLTKDGRKVLPIYSEIVASGGIHQYLEFDGNIILSTIMPDRQLYGLTAEHYAGIINDLSPDYYFTPDGETYFCEEKLSAYEISRMLSETDFLIDTCGRSRAIGLVKGCKPQQIIQHTKSLISRGVDKFVFHAGDYLHRGNTFSIRQSALFYEEIVKIVPWLLIYGVGSYKNFRTYRKARGFIPQSHFTYRFESNGGHRTPDNAQQNKERIIRSYEAIELDLILLENEDFQISKCRPIDTF